MFKLSTTLLSAGEKIADQKENQHPNSPAPMLSRSSTTLSPALLRLHPPPPLPAAAEASTVVLLSELFALLLFLRWVRVCLLLSLPRMFALNESLEQGECGLAAARPAGRMWVDRSASSTTHASTPTNTHIRVRGCHLKGKHFQKRGWWDWDIGEKKSGSNQRQAASTYRV
jgi:hypothetical protein